VSVAKPALQSSGITEKTWFVPVVAVLVVVVCSILAYARIPGADRGIVWAEDGRVFLGQRYDLGVASSLFHVYAGYLQFVPRLVTDVATLVEPLSSYGLVVTRLTSLITGVIAGLVFVCSRDVVSSRWARVALASITVLAPMLPLEVLGNSANIHWLFLWLAPWLLLFRPTRWWQSGVVAAVLLATVLTEIQALLFLPLILFQIRHRKTWPVGAALLVGGACQIASAISAPRDPSKGPPVTFLNIVLGYVQNILVGGTTGSAARTGYWLSTDGWQVGILFAVPFVIAIVVVILRSRLTEYPVLLALLAGAIVTWVASAIANADTRFLYSSQTQAQLAAGGLIRYAVVPSMFLLALIVVAGDKLWAGRAVALKVAGGAVLVACILVRAASFSAPVTRRDGGPEWALGYAAAVSTCLSGAASASILTSPKNWNVVLACPVVLARR
jgi:hypothetical protein